MLEGLSTLHKGGVRPRWVVIDDGWQRTTNDDALNSEQWDERLVALEANKRFRSVNLSARGGCDCLQTSRAPLRKEGDDNVYLHEFLIMG